MKDEEPPSTERAVHRDGRLRISGRCDVCPTWPKRGGSDAFRLPARITASPVVWPGGVYAWLCKSATVEGVHVAGPAGPPVSFGKRKFYVLNDVGREELGRFWADYLVAWEQIKVHLFPYAGFTGRNLMPILDGALGLLEETAADGQSIHEVLGGDIKGFCAALAGGDGASELSRQVAQAVEHENCKEIGPPRRLMWDPRHHRGQEAVAGALGGAHGAGQGAPAGLPDRLQGDSEVPLRGRSRAPTLRDCRFLRGRRRCRQKSPGTHRQRRAAFCDDLDSRTCAEKPEGGYLKRMSAGDLHTAALGDPANEEAAVGLLRKVLTVPFTDPVTNT